MTDRAEWFSPDVDTAIGGVYERLYDEGENEELRSEIAKHMDVYRETLHKLVTYKVRCEQGIKLLQGVDE